jgi:hypothetical protein
MGTKLTEPYFHKVMSSSGLILSLRAQSQSLVHEITNVSHGNKNKKPNTGSTILHSVPQSERPSLHLTL